MKTRNDLLREKILAGSNEYCFIDREMILKKHEEKILSLPGEEQYLAAFVLVADGVSTPIEEEDIFAGRFREALWPYKDLPLSRASGILRTSGHITWDWERVLQKGLLSFQEEIESTAEKNPTSHSLYFAGSVRTFLDAVKRLAIRWSKACLEKSLETENPLYKKTLSRAGEALKHVPLEPAYDFFSALQSFWFWHWVNSGLCGARDYAPGRMDQYLLPFYRRDLEKGILTEEEAVELLANLFLKLNELSGTATEDFHPKPTPCQASKQYVTLGGTLRNGECGFNELSSLIVKASAECALPQPTLNFRLACDMPDEVWSLAGKAALLPSIPNFFNEKIIKNTLLRKGIREEDIHHFDFTACNRVNLPGKLYNIMERIDRFTDPVRWLCKVLNENQDASGMEEILQKFYEAARKEISEILARSPYSDSLYFTPDSMIVDECREKGVNIRNLASPRYHWQHLMFTGIATIGDSLNTIHELVFRRRRFTLAEYLAIVDSNFQGQEELRREILQNIPHFGNGEKEGDHFAVRAAELLLDAADDAGEDHKMITVCSFYSLSQHFRFGAALGATPDGRLAGEPVSENMSPVYGRDRNGPTSLLRSVASLPLHRTVCGGLNLKLGASPGAGQLAGLIKGFFAIGGLHTGISIVNRHTLEEADKDPEKYPLLLVRKFGFSEYFASLSPEYRQEIIQRTEY